MKKAQDTNQSPTTSEQALIAPNSRITLTIDADTAKSAYTKTINTLAKKVKVSGFRPGKVPAKIAEEQLNSEYVIEKTLQLVLPDIYEAAIKEAGKKPITYPEFKAISVEPDQAWEVEAQFAEQPTIELKDYKKTVSSTRKEAEKEWTAQEKSNKTDKKEAAEHDHAHEGHDHTHDEPSAEQKKKEFIVQKIYSALAAAIKPQIPELLVKQEAQYEVDQLVKQLEMFNMKLEDFLARRNLSFEQFSSEVTATALGRLQLMFILTRISDDQKLTVTDADIDNAIAENKNSEYVEQQKTNPEYRSYLQETISRQKVVDYLLSL